MKTFDDMLEYELGEEVQLFNAPNCAYERAEKEFDDWFNDTRTKKALETLSE